MCGYRSRLVVSCCDTDTAFKTFDISQDSAAIHLTCGGIFSDSIITNFLLILTVKYFLNRLIFGKVKAYKNSVPNFGATLYD